MHRQNPLAAGFVGYSGGGSRTLIDTIDDGQLMQEMKGAMMHGESREKVESPQNYGFSSVVRPATKGSDGKIQDAAEGYMSYAGGNRTHSFCAVMDDRRYRPLGLKPGENCQYDDLGQMTLLRRTGLYLLTTDNPEQGSSSGGSGAAPGQHADSAPQSVQRFVSVRHVVKKTQDRPKRGGGQQSGSSSSPQDFKHEGETVNTEVRFSKKNLEFRTGDNVVASHDKDAAKWEFGGKVHSVVSTDQHSVSSKQVSINGSQTVNISGTNGIALTGPTSINGNPVATSDMLDVRDTMIARLEARVAALEARISA